MADTATIGASASVVVETSSRTSSRTRSSQSCLRGIGFGQDDDAALDTKQIEDRQVLGGLRHRALVGGDDQQRGVDAADAGEHVLDEPLVTGDIDDADLWPPGSVSQAKPRSIVMARAFSSASRSGSIPVRALTSVDFPWSTWPAVPITNGRIGGIAVVCESLALGRVMPMNQPLRTAPAKNVLSRGLPTSSNSSNPSPHPSSVRPLSHRNGPGTGCPLGMVGFGVRASVKDTPPPGPPEVQHL